MKGPRPLGQVFLHSQHYIQKITDNLDIDGADVLEIGPGRGAITYFLAAKAASLVCIEIDTALANELSQKFSLNTKVKIINEDILRFESFSSQGSKVVFGNVPYNISKELIEYLIANRLNFSKAYLTFQKEFADKLFAKPGDSQYGVLSCRLQFYCKVTPLFDIPAGAFRPVPKVESSFIRLDFLTKPAYDVIDEDLFWRLIRQGFSQRRKKIANTLDLSPEVFESIGINKDSRPQELSLSDYAKLSRYLQENRDV
jgi:16S rRNA (adenine1518-N6/adenine1519-N6)-dimethyltransferase